MTKDEFCALPPAIALGLVYDMARAKLEPMRCPDVPRPPKYDGRIYRKGGFVWMSEMLLEDLEWWRKTKAESADGDGDYAERDAKIVVALDMWILWRRLFPRDQWSGTRGDDRAVAAPPSKEPKLRTWEARGTGGSSSQGGSKSTGPKRGAPPPVDDDEPNYGF